MKNGYVKHGRKNSSSIILGFITGALALFAASQADGAVPGCVSAPSGLVSWWRGEGNALDSVDGNNGTLAGNTTYGAVRVGQGFVFDGSTDLVTVGNPANLQLQDFTIEAWIKRASSSVVSYGWYGNGIIFGYGYGGYGLYLDPSGRPALSKIGINEVKPSVTITDTNLHHVAVTKSGSTVIFYVDGTAYSAAAYDPGFVFSTVAAIGARGDNLDNSFLGTIDETAVYNRALSATEVQAIYNAGNAGKCAPTPPPACAPAPSGLVSWWKGENNALDSVDGNNGTLMYGAAFASGKVGQGFSFGGGNSRILLGDSENLKFTNSFTIEAWIYATGLPTGPWGQILMRCDTRDYLDPYYLAMRPDGGIRFHVEDDSGSASHGADVDTTPIPLGQWKHVAGVFDATAGTLQVFIDGALTAQINTAVRPFRDLDPNAEPGVSIGNTMGFVQGFNGMIDELAVYARALSPAEIAAIHTAGSAGKCAPPPPPNCVPAPSGLVSWWRAEGNALDSADSNNGTLAGNTTYGAGRVGQAFVLDGNGDAVRVGNPANLQLQNFTIEAWIKRASSSVVSHGSYGNGIIFGYGYGGYGLYLDPSGRPVLSKIGINEVKPSVTITDTNLHHVAVTKSGSTVIFYVDGTAYSAAAYDPGFVFSTVAAIGARGDNLDNSFLGTIDETAVYNRALFATEIEAIYAAGSAGKCAPTPPAICVPAPSGLVSWWRGEGNALDSVDGNNGTLAGNTIYGAGRVGQGFVFDGSTDLVTVGNPANLQVQDFTIEAWIKRGSASVVSHGSFGNGIIFGYGYGGYGLYLDPSGTPALSKIGISATTPATTITDTNLHHLAVTKSGSTVIFYVDGTAYSAVAYDPGFEFSTVAAIGARGDNLDNSFLGAIDETAVYNRALSATEIQAIYNAGSAGKCTALLPVNHLPVADATATKPLLIVPAGCSPTVVLDGSRSSDPDADPLQYRWFKTGETNAFATGGVAMVTLPLGAHSITLVVDDGLATATNAVTVTVITARQAVQKLVVLVNESNIDHPRPLLAMLSAAADSLRRHHPRVAIIQLHAFQHLVRVEVNRHDPVQAAELVQAAEQVIEALSQDCALAGPHWKIGKLHRHGNGQMRMEFSAPEEQVCLIQASTNLVDWETIGVAVEFGPGEFEFEDPDAARLPARFYRIVSP